jgi:hypothetical protein
VADHSERLVSISLDSRASLDDIAANKPAAI